MSSAVFISRNVLIVRSQLTRDSAYHLDTEIVEYFFFMFSIRFSCVNHQSSMIKIEAKSNIRRSHMIADHTFMALDSFENSKRRFFLTFVHFNLSVPLRNGGKTYFG